MLFSNMKKIAAFFSNLKLFVIESIIGNVFTAKWNLSIT